jgi:hypothetical protein
MEWGMRFLTELQHVHTSGGLVRRDSSHDTTQGSHTSASAYRQARRELDQSDTTRSIGTDGCTANCSSRAKAQE